MKATQPLAAAAIVFAFLARPGSIAARAPAGGSALESQPSAVLEAPEDRAASPFTGYTRRHWLEITEKLIAGVLPYFDPETGMPELAGAPGETGHFQHLVNAGGDREAFGRSLTMVAFYTAATGRDRVPGYDGSDCRTLPEGNHPRNRPVRPSLLGSAPPVWGDGHERRDGDAREPALSLGSPDRRAEEKRPRLPAGSRRAPIAYDSNHWYFHMAAVPLLARAGMDSHRSFLTSMFRRLLGWYRGDGWFVDGSNRSFDLYNLWGFQLYNQQLVRYDEPVAPRVRRRGEPDDRALPRELPVPVRSRRRPDPVGPIHRVSLRPPLGASAGPSSTAPTP